MKAKLVDGVYHILSKYNTSSDIRFSLEPISTNNTYQLGDIYLVDKTTGAETIWYKQTTDMVQPWCRLGATTNIDGDLKDSTSLIFTGGWHGYTNTNSGTPTATTVAHTPSTPLTSSYKVVSNLSITVVNNIQGFNTIKEDGSGRAILKEQVTYTFKENKIGINVKATPLEDVSLFRYYFMGFQKAWDIKDTMTVIGDPYYVAPMTSYDTAVYGGIYEDSKPKAMRFAGPSKIVTMGFDTDYTHNNTRPSWFYREYGKAYYQPLASFDNVTGGETYTSLTPSNTLEYNGYYKFEDKLEAKRYTVYNNGVSVKTDYAPIQLASLAPKTVYDKISVSYENEELQSPVPKFTTTDKTPVRIFADKFTKGVTTSVTGMYTGTAVSKISLLVDGTPNAIVSLKAQPKTKLAYYTGKITPETLSIRLHNEAGAVIGTQEVTLV
nr:MAG TPA: hypothetical protein [Caudoviricetes sp.]